MFVEVKPCDTAEHAECHTRKRCELTSGRRVSVEMLARDDKECREAEFFHEFVMAAKLHCIRKRNHEFKFEREAHMGRGAGRRGRYPIKRDDPSDRRRLAAETVLPVF
jgi:hypothetical protein